MTNRGRKFIWTIVLMLAMSALAACGTANKAAEGNAVQAGNTAEEAAAASATPTESSNNASEEGATRTITGEFGDVEIPVNPKRVAGIYVEDYLEGTRRYSSGAVVSSKLGQAGLSESGCA